MERLHNPIDNITTGRKKSNMVASTTDRLMVKRFSSHRLERSNSMDLDSVTGEKREDSELSVDEHPLIPVRV